MGTLLKFAKTGSSKRHQRNNNYNVTLLYINDIQYNAITQHIIHNATNQLVDWNRVCTSAVVRSVENFALQTDAGGSVRFRPRQLNLTCASIGFVLIFDVLTLSCVSIMQSGSGPLSLSERFTQVQLANEARSRGGRGGGGGGTKFTITTMGGGGGGAGAAITSPSLSVLQNSPLVCQDRLGTNERTMQMLKMRRCCLSQVGAVEAARVAVAAVADVGAAAIAAVDAEAAAAAERKPVEDEVEEEARKRSPVQSAVTPGRRQRTTVSHC